MILGIGNDLVDIGRIEVVLERHGERFIKRCFTQEEREKADRRKASDTHAQIYAKRFAAKEACAKALGTGLAKGISWQDISVINDAEGRPFLKLTGGALKRLEQITPAGQKAVIHLSLTDEPPFAQAFVVIEAY